MEASSGAIPAPTPQDERSWLVVQWPMKSARGTERDSWLIDRASEWLEAYLGENGLGWVDGHDRGARLGDHGGFVINLFCRVTDPEKAATGVMACLRKAGLDATRATVATMAAGQDQYTVRHERHSNTLPGPFSL